MRTSWNEYKTMSWGLITNSIGSIYTSLYATRYFLLNEGKDKGVVINVSPMICDQELVYLSKHFKTYFNIEGFTVPLAKYFSKHKIRILSISPSSIDTLLPKIDYISESEKARAVIIDSVIKRYKMHDEFVHLVLSSITDANLNGILLELDSNQFTAAPVIARI